MTSCSRTWYISPVIVKIEPHTNCQKKHKGFFQLLHQVDTFLTKTDSVMQGYPLRPELMESTFLLHSASNHPGIEESSFAVLFIRVLYTLQCAELGFWCPVYLEMGRLLQSSLQERARTECGYASLADVLNGKKIVFCPSNSHFYCDLGM